MLFTYTEVAMTQHLCQGSCHPTGGDVRYCYLPVSDRQIIWTWGWRIVVCFMGLAKSHHLIGLLSNRNTEYGWMTSTISSLVYFAICFFVFHNRFTIWSPVTSSTMIRRISEGLISLSNFHQAILLLHCWLMFPLF